MNAKERKKAHNDFAERLSSALGVKVFAKRKLHKNWLIISVEPWAESRRTISDDDLDTFQGRTDLGKAQMVLDGVQALKSAKTKLEESIDRIL